MLVVDPVPPVGVQFRDRGGQFDAPQFHHDNMHARKLLEYW